ncbi:hypothetical protein PPERSA_07743 [Pseudocohnilembus persalinus]|uniref:Uncharacterized protein n=1 Tax=Pseudocohnilembus persalinus TaxID=266149 RepID=A0A0V0R9V8_PSEPJ|nr:hypothetical protein PPERSA_07743 [Pseudocohnilembus persalinus]|eukprot:KRX11218.1 hypothetical protein PPERSA_07743 [Pseudocohnilembus persalinus]
MEQKREEKQVKYFDPADIKEITPVLGKERAKTILKLKQDRFQHKNMSESAEEKIEKIKKKDRTYFSQLKDWYKNKYAYTNTCQLLLKNCPQEIDEIEYKDYSSEDFYQNHA